MSARRPVEPDLPDLQALALAAAERGLLLRLRVQRPAGLIWTLRVGVARPLPRGLILLGELRGWALPHRQGLRLDTMRVQEVAPSCADRAGIEAVGPLIWAASFAWALEATPCRQAWLLAIDDGERQHRRLVRYFRRLGFEPWRRLGGAAADLAPRLLWGGAGLLMRGDCREGLRRSVRRLGL
jgi:hypothetical protein